MSNPFHNLPLFRPALTIETEYRDCGAGYGKGRAILRFGDECKNGHNTFSLTAESTMRRIDRRLDLAWWGCCHDIVREVWPEYAHLIKWHLTSTDGPLHYVANTLYWARVANGEKRYNENESPKTALQYARNAAVWPEATLAQLSNELVLLDRLEPLLHDFYRDMSATFGHLATNWKNNRA